MDSARASAQGSPMRALVLLVLIAIAPIAGASEWLDEVDVELFLAVDVSRSMAPSELEIQRRGYASALRAPEVVRAITGGLIGTVAITYVEWAGLGGQRVVIPWTRISSKEEADRFATLIESGYRPSLWRTSISSALDFARQSIETNDAHGLRRVIDISGDGPNNQGGIVTFARDRAVESGITINGLPLMTRVGTFSRVHLDDLDAYYVHCVIGGPGAFTIPVLDWAQFAEAVKKKLVLEISGRTRAPRLVPAQYSGWTETGYDCLIGEKMWEQNRRYRGGP